MSSYILGLTGGIGSGKTTVANLFADNHSIAVVDADICARIVVEKGTPALKHIREHFGDNVIMDDGTLDRARLRQIVFQDPAEKKWLESLLHPLIFEEMLEQLESANSPYAILVSPLLIEAGQNSLCNRVLVIDTPETTQLSRTMARDNNTADQVKAIMDSQASRMQRLAHADDIITNDGDLASAASQVARLHEKILQLL
jgi:dephospho-CoA kinase